MANTKVEALKKQLEVYYAQIDKYEKIFLANDGEIDEKEQRILDSIRKKLGEINNKLPDNEENTTSDTTEEAPTAFKEGFAQLKRATDTLSIKITALKGTDKFEAVKAKLLLQIEKIKTNSPKLKPSFKSFSEQVQLHCTQQLETLTCDLNNLENIINNQNEDNSLPVDTEKETLTDSEIESKLILTDKKIKGLEKETGVLETSCTSPENATKISSKLNDAQTLLKELDFLSDLETETTYSIEYNGQVKRLGTCKGIFNHFLDNNPTLQSKYSEIIDVQNKDQATEKLLLEIGQDIEDLDKEVDGYKKQGILFENKDNLGAILKTISTKMASLSQMIDEENQPLYYEYRAQVEKLKALENSINTAKNINQSIEEINLADVETKLNAVSEDLKLLEKNVYAYNSKHLLFDHKEELLTNIQSIQEKLDLLNPILTSNNETFILEHKNHNKQLETLKTQVVAAQQIIPSSIKELHHKLDLSLKDCQQLVSDTNKNQKDNPAIKTSLAQIETELSTFNKMISEHLEDDTVFEACSTLFKGLQKRQEALVSDYDKLQANLKIAAKSQANLDKEMKDLLNNDPAALAKQLWQRLEKVEEDYQKFLEAATPNN